MRGGNGFLCFVSGKCMHKVNRSVHIFNMIYDHFMSKYDPSCGPASNCRRKKVSCLNSLTKMSHVIGIVRHEIKFKCENKIMPHVK